MSQRYKVTLTFTQELLGTVAKDPNIYEDYIASKANLADEHLAEELATVPTVEETMKLSGTGFHREKGEPFLYDYVIKGFFKDACGMLRRAGDTKSSKLKAYKKVIDGLVFITPRKILLQLPKGEGLVSGGFPSERPLRASTPQGERIALAKSDVAPVGTRIEFTIDVLGGVSESLLKEWLDYGALRGLGQWRNAGWGTFAYELEKL